ncbi:MAG: DUF5906 domain-containing protein, partial [Planctomycetota bacterium]
EGGREAVREAMASAIRLAVATAPPDEPVDRVDDGASLPPLDLRTATAGGDEHRVLPSQSVDVVEWFLRECYGSADPQRASGACYRLVWMREEWRIYNGRFYEQVKPEQVKGSLRLWLMSMFKWVQVKLSPDDQAKAGSKTEEQLKPVVPNKRMLAEYIDTLQDEVHVAPKELPAYIEATYRTDGTSMRHVDDHGRRVLSEDEAANQLLPDLRRSLVFADGTMSHESLLAADPEIRPHDERLLSILPMPFAWPADATSEARRGNMDGWLADQCPNFIAHLGRIDDFNSGASEAIVRHHGASFAGIHDDEIAMWMHGPKGSGKSTLLKALMAHLGDSACDGMSLAKIEKPEYQIHIEGKRAVAFSDAAAGGFGQLATNEFLKMMIDGSKLQARGLYKDVVNFVFKGRAWFASNTVPKIRDHGDALGSRMIWIQFPKGVRGTAKQTPAYAAKIYAEARASMVYCVWNGLREYLLDRQRGVRRLIKPPALHGQSMGIFGESSNKFGRFVEDHIEYDFEEVNGEVPWLSVQAIHEAFRRSCGVKPDDNSFKWEDSNTGRNFNGEMSDALHDRGKRQGRWRGSAYIGVRFRRGSIDELWGDDTVNVAMHPEAALQDLYAAGTSPATPAPPL